MVVVVEMSKGKGRGLVGYEVVESYVQSNYEIIPRENCSRNMLSNSGNERRRRYFTFNSTSCLRALEIPNGLQLSGPPPPTSPKPTPSFFLSLIFPVRIVRTEMSYNLAAAGNFPHILIWKTCIKSAEFSPF